MRSLLVTFVFFALTAGIIWASSQDETQVNGAYPGHDKNCSCSTEKLSEARHAHDVRDFMELVLDSGL